MAGGWDGIQLTGMKVHVEFLLAAQIARGAEYTAMNQAWCQSRTLQPCGEKKQLVSSYHNGDECFDRKRTQYRLREEGPKSEGLKSKGPNLAQESETASQTQPELTFAILALACGLGGSKPFS